MSRQTKCWLKSVDNDNLRVFLENNVEIQLGRCPETDIKDKRCSRKQVAILARYDLGTVSVKHIGENPCCTNGIILRNDTFELKHDEVLEFLVGEHKFKVEFDPMPKNNIGEKRTHVANHSVTEERSPEPKHTCTDKNSSTMPQPCGNNIWEKIEDGKLYIFTCAGVTSSPKIAAYDLDGTIILTSSGKVFPIDNNDWKIANGYVKNTLRKYASLGYKIVFFTNQAGIGTGKTNINGFKSKIENIISALNIPIQVFIATSTSIYRKPAPGMWTYLETKKNDGITIDMTASFFVGDASGRVVNWAPGKKKDFSSADRLFAINIKLPFFTPEEHFLNNPPGKYVLPSFNPSALKENAQVSDRQITSNSTEVVIMVGYPGSGKSHFVRQHMVPAGYVHVNRDTLGSWQKCVSVMESALSQGRRVVIDNTNPDRQSRKRFIDKASVPCRCFVMTTSLEHVRHNNRFRDLTDTKHIPVNDMIINSYKNKLEAPSLEEGFTEIVNIDFVPTFSDPELKKLYQMYLLEK